QLASRISGHPEWNRHVMYRATKMHYVEILRWRYRQRALRSLRITDKGIEYIAKHAPDKLPLLLSRQIQNARCHEKPEKTYRVHTIATGMVMAENAGARIYPTEKPSLLKNGLGSGEPPNDNASYYYSIREIRDAIMEATEKAIAKTARIIGIIVRGRYCYCLYYTGFSRLYWRPATEHNLAAAIQSILIEKGFRCDTIRQIIIGSTLRVAETIAKQGMDRSSRYLTVSKYYDKCHFITNDSNGDALLRLIINPELATDFEKSIMIPAFLPPPYPTRSYDAVTPDGSRPVILNYQFELSSLILIDTTPDGFSQPPILLCLDYQVDIIQKIVGAMIEVRAIEKEMPR
ncbi:MAG: hypothetical protein J5851_08505, partial [Oscillospiraceae bacterium]|nr:hypothetical protein [Oscillospiraceae bacterium]